MKRMGYILSPYGAPLATRPVEVRNNATGALVTTGATDSNGRWEFDLADEALAYRVEIGLGGASPQKVAQAPASLELEYLFVRYGTELKGPVELPPGTSIGGVPIDPSAPPNTGALDPRYIQKTGGSPGGVMTGGLALVSPSTLDGQPLFTQATGDTLYVNITGDVMTGALAVNQNEQATALTVTTAAVSAVQTAPTISGQRARGTIAAPAAVQAADHLIRYDGLGYQNGAYRLSSRIAMLASAAPSGTAVPGIIYFQTADAAGTLQNRMSLDHQGLATFAGGIYAETRGHRIGALSATPATGAVIDTDASIFLYNNSPTNWSGFGGDGSGNMWWRVGLSGNPAPLLQLMATGPILRVAGQMEQLGGYAYLGSFNSQARPRQGTDLGVNWNFSGGGAEINLWNTVFGPTNSFVFRQMLTASTHRDLLVLGASGAITALASLTVNGVLTLQNPNASIDTINMKNPSQDSTTWIFGIQGPAANVAWPGALSLYNTIGGAIMQVFNDGRIGIGGQAINGAALLGTVAISARSSAYPTLRVMWGASQPATTAIFRVDRSDGALIFGVTNQGLVTDTYTSKVPTNNSTNAHIPVYASNGSFIGYIVLYN